MPREPKPNDRRNEFVQAAEELFNEKGYENTSIDDVAAKVGVAKGLFYYYFDSKDRLLEELVVRLIEETRKNVQEVMAEEGLSALERLRRLGEANAAIKGRSIKIVAYFQEDRNKALHYAMEDRSMEFMVPAMESIVCQGVEEGVFSTPYPRETAIALLCTFRAISHERMFNLEPATKLELVEVLEFLMCRLLGTEQIHLNECSGKAKKRKGKA
jgi:AcrR family transcriptional regulator